MTDDVIMAETSKDGARRMRKLQNAALTCGPSPYGFIDPITSSLAYLAPNSSQYRGHLLTTLASTQPPKQLPTASNVTPGQQISISPDGEWVTVFHPNPSLPGGILAIYSSGILSPSSATRAAVPLATFSLANAPLAIHHNYQPRLHTSKGRGAARGPGAPMTYDPAHGPSITSICADGIYLFHPFRSLDTVSLDTVGSVSLGLAAGNNQPVWRMQMLKCPLHTRFRAVMGGEMATDTGLRARKGWIGTVGDSDAVWVGYEAGKVVKVVRVEYEEDDSGAFSMTTVPLPSLPLRPAPPFSETDISAGDIHTEIKGLVFVSLGSQSSGDQDGENAKEKPHSFSDERVAVVQILQDQTLSGNTFRTRLEACQIENREFELAEGFKELGNDHSDGAVSSDWITLSRLPSTSLSPNGYTILALCPLPALEPPSLALSLLQTKDGVIMSHLDLADTSAGPPESPWAALRGDPIRIREDVGSTDVSLYLSQGVERGGLGLVAIMSRETGALLTVGPKLRAKAIQSDEKPDVAGVAVEAALSVALAIQQRSGWTDVIRAAFASQPEAEKTTLGESIIRQTYQRLEDDSTQVDKLGHLFSLQVAIFGALNDPRQSTASELVRLLDACYLFTRCASKGPGKNIVFDLASIWPLIAVADWIGGVLAEMMRAVITARGHLEWNGGDLPVDAMTARILYLAHPTLRALVVRLHSQLNAFVHFVVSLETPIPHANANPLTLGDSRDPRATILAKANVMDVLGKEGVDLAEWGKAIQAIPTSLVSDTDVNEALLLLACDPIRSVIPQIIQALPTPSALLRSTSRFSEYQHDAITLERLAEGATGLGKCDRCAWKTGVLGDQGWLGMGAWGQRRKEQERQCVCGGTWVRDMARLAA